MKLEAKKSRGRPRRTTPDLRTASDRHASLIYARRERGTLGAQTFDSLPDAARIRQPVVELLFSISPTTVWRRVKAGELPPPRLDGRIASWSAAEIRAALTGRNKATE